MTRRRWCVALPSFLALALAFLAFTAGVLLAPPAASAHAILTSSMPSNGSVLEAAPGSITLTFDEGVTITEASIQLYDAGQRALEVGPTRYVVGSDAQIVADVPEIGLGTFVVIYRVTSTDGHPITGAVSFRVGAGSEKVDTADIVAALSSSGSSVAAGRLLNVSRLLAFVGWIVLLGSVLLVIVSRSTASGEASVQRLWSIAWVLLAVGTVASFMFQAPYTLGGGLGGAVDPDRLSSILDTRYGMAMVWRSVALIVIAGLIRSAGAYHLAGWWRAAALGAAAVLALTFAFAGHPGAFNFPGMGVALDVLHSSAVGVWIGGLALLLFGGRAWLRDESRAATAHTFSRWALVCVPVIVVTGVVQAARIGGLTLDSAYGKRLLVKVILVAVIVVLGYISRAMLRGRGPQAVRSTVMVEALLAVVVLGVTSVLVATTPRQAQAGQVFQRTFAQGDLIADVVLTPGRAGANEMHVTVQPPGGTLQRVVSVTARFKLPSRDIPSIDIALVEEAPNHFSSPSVVLPFSGEWTMDLVIEPLPNQTVLVRDTVNVP